MTDDIMLTTISLHSGQLLGNCGVRQAYRLKGTYCNEAEMQERMNQGAADRTLKQITLSNSTKRSAVLMLEAFINGPASHRIGRAIPLEWAYIYALEKVHGGSYSLICLSDTDRGQGDGHGGAFSTRGFAQWLASKGLCEMVKAQAQRKGCDYDIMGYWMIPDHESMDKYLHTGIKAIAKGMEEWNNDERVKAATTTMDDVSEQELKDKLRGAWVAEFDEHEFDEYGNDIDPFEDPDEDPF